MIFFSEKSPAEIFKCSSVGGQLSTFTPQFYLLTKDYLPLAFQIYILFSDENYK